MRLSTRFDRGLSLVEVAIYSALALLLMGSVYGVLVIGLRYSGSSQTYADAQREAMLAVRKIGQELCNGNPAAVSLRDVDSGGSVIIEDHIFFMSADQPYPNQDAFWQYNTFGELLWWKWVCFYHDAANQRLVRSEIIEPTGPLALPPMPSQPAPNEGIPILMITDFKAVTSPLSKVLANNVSAVEFQKEVDRIRLELRMTYSTGSGPNNVTEIVVPSLVRMKNAPF